MAWTDILPPVLIPFLVSLFSVAVVLSLRLLWALPLALVAAYVTTHVIMVGVPPFPAIAADEWLVYAALAAGPLAIIEAYLPRRQRFGPLLWLIFLAALTWICVGPRIGLFPTVLLALSITAALALAAYLFTPSTNEIRPLTSTNLWILAIVSAASALVLLLGASAKLAFLAMSLANFALATALVLFVHSTITKTGVALHTERLIPLYFTLLFGLFLSGVLFAKTPLIAAVLIGVAATTALAIRRRSRVAAIVTALLLCAAAAGFTYYTIHIAPPPAVEDEYDPYSW